VVRRDAHRVRGWLAIVTSSAASASASARSSSAVEAGATAGAAAGTTSGSAGAAVAVAVALPEVAAAGCGAGLPPAGRPSDAVSAPLPADDAPCPPLASASGRCWDFDLERLPPLRFAFALGRCHGTGCFLVLCKCTTSESGEGIKVNDCWVAGSMCLAEGYGKHALRVWPTGLKRSSSTQYTGLQPTCGSCPAASREMNSGEEAACAPPGAAVADAAAALRRLLEGVRTIPGPARPLQRG
jgi:hypothetical protein